MAEVHRLDLARFTRADIEKVEALAGKMRLLRRWYRYERIAREDGEHLVLYSGDRGPAPYAALRIIRREDGTYDMQDHRSGEQIASARNIQALLHQLPDSFYSSAAPPGAGRTDR